MVRKERTVKIKTFLTKTGHKTIAPETAGILEPAETDMRCAKSSGICMPNPVANFCLDQSIGIDKTNTFQLKFVF